MDNDGFRYHACCSLHNGGIYKRSKERSVRVMIISFAAVGTALASFAEGAILAASVYLVSRGVRNPLRNRKK